MIHEEKTQHAIRRSTRLPLEVPVLVTSLDPATPFCEPCNTNLVNAHGCGVIVMRPIAQGTRVRLEIVSARRRIAARVAEVVPLGGDPETWLVGLELDVPGNFWGIQYAPSDWNVQESSSAAMRTEHYEPPGWPNAASKSAGVSSVARRWRLSDISAGACYLESDAPFPVGAPVLISIRVSDTEFLIEGTVRVSHPQTGMGVEFSNEASEQSARIEELIDVLMSRGESPRIFVGRKEAKEGREESRIGEGDKTVAKRRQHSKADVLLNLIYEGSASSIERFMANLRAQRNGISPSSQLDLSMAKAGGSSII